MKRTVESKIERPFNTKQKGVMEFLVYKEKSNFVAVCLTFDIVEEGKEATELIKSITDAAKLHLETVIKHKMSDELLNRYAPLKYWKKYFRATEQIKTQSLKPISNYPVVSPYKQSSLRLQFA
jgi:hypothetical protein